MFDGFGISAHDQQPKARHVRQSGPDLLGVHNPLVAVAHCFAAQAGKV